MSLFTEAAAALTPMESQEDREAARDKIRDVSSPGDWLSTILDHHLELERAFSATKSAAGADRKASLKQLAVLITGHAIAEEAAIYPALAESGEKSEAEHAYTEQATVKMQMAELDKLDPASQEFTDKLEAIREAVAHHMYEEEGTWFPDLAQSASPEDQRLMADHYNEAFDRFVGDDAKLLPA